MRAGVDVGYGFVKAVSSTGARVLFPSVVARLFGDRRLELPGIAAGEPRYVVEVDFGGGGQRYAVGDYAVDCEGAVRAWHLDGQASHKNTRVLLYAACAVLGCGPGADLGIGLPLELYMDGRAAEWRREFAGKTARVRVGSGPVREVSFSRVLVLPQAAGAFFSAALSGDGLGKELLTQNVGIVDVGYRTTDLLLMRRHPGMVVSRPDPRLSTTVDRGVSWVYQQVWMAVQSKLGRIVDELAVEAGFLYGGGVFRAGGEVFDLEGEAEEYRGQLAREIGDQVRRHWGGRLDQLDALLVAGGGGEYLYDHLQALLPGCRLLPDAAYSNAQGYLAALSG